MADRGFDLPFTVTTDTCWVLLGFLHWIWWRLATDTLPIVSLYGRANHHCRPSQERTVRLCLVVSDTCWVLLGFLHWIYWRLATDTLPIVSLNGRANHCRPSQKMTASTWLFVTFTYLLLYQVALVEYFLNVCIGFGGGLRPIHYRLYL